LAAYKCKLIDLIQAVCHWCPYLWGRLFLVRTNHFTLKFLLDQHLSTIPQHQWARKLPGFNFKVEYKSGATNIIVDALSWRDTEVGCELTALSVPTLQLFTDLHIELTGDPGCGMRWWSEHMAMTSASLMASLQCMTESTFQPLHLCS
jgi:hypothetical protein